MQTTLHLDHLSCFECTWLENTRQFFFPKSLVIFLCSKSRGLFFFWDGVFLALSPRLDGTMCNLGSLQALPPQFTHTHSPAQPPDAGTYRRPPPRPADFCIFSRDGFSPMLTRMVSISRSHDPPTLAPKCWDYTHEPPRLAIHGPYCDWVV